MDVQLKRGMLDICVLASLLQGDSYGYMIIKDLSPYVEISESTLYPILRRLEEMRAVETYSMAHNGRLRKYYAITPLGQRRIRVFLDEWKSMMDIYAYIEKEMNNK
ncbi:MAG: PadR family transcriptional regulator [Bacilli bacterium]|jgi:PadR family transcriptional regulator PadR|nr:PadR family transcriptional regulator [Bacilli bacterium]